MIRLLLRVLGREGSQPLRRALVLMVIAAIAEGLAYALLLPILRALLTGDAGGALPWLAGFAGAVVITTVLRYRSDVSGFTTGGALSRVLHHRLGDQLARLPLGWFTPAKVGDVAMLTARSVLQVMAVPAHQLQPLASALLTPATVTVVMLVADWRIGLAAVIATPLVALVYRWTGTLTRRQDAERAARADEVASRVVEFVRAQPVLRTGGRTTEGFRLLEDALEEQRAAGRRAALAAVPGVIALSFTVQLIFTALLALAVFLLLQGKIAAADALALLVVTARCVDPLLSLSELGGKIRASRAELARIDAVLDARPLPEPERGVQPSGSTVQFDDVTVVRGGRPVLSGLSLSVPAGSTVAVVGPSGAGKSTMLQLVARFFDGDSGSVRIGAVDVRDVGTDALMGMIAMVFQDVYLFAGSIEDNVRMGRPDASGAELAGAARAARLDEVIERLPQGWETPVGEGGVALSGGERQRVSIARALLKDAPILLLDEATSALDAANEAAVTDGLDRLREGRTVLMVTHRLRTAERADQIVFLTDGRVVESGTHAELLRSGTYYPRFWNAFDELDDDALVSATPE